MDTENLQNLKLGEPQELISHMFSADKQSMATIAVVTSNPSFFSGKTNANLILVKSVQLIVLGNVGIHCVASSQGLYALNSEIVLEADTLADFLHCVATHGGAIALYEESYIRVGKNASLKLNLNHAFQIVGAIYASSAPGVVPVSDCFLQYDQGEENKCVFSYFGNTAKGEGQSVYVSDIQNCFSGRTLKNITTHLINDPNEEEYNVSSTFVQQVNFTFIFNRTLYNMYY